MNFRQLLSRLKPPRDAVAAPAGRAPSIIAADVDIDGDLNSSGELQVDGNVRGHVRAQAAVIDVNGVVHGGVAADEVVVHGRVLGPVHGVHVHIYGTAHVEGDVISTTLSIEKGAWVAGSLRRSEEPLSEPARSYLPDPAMQREWSNASSAAALSRPLQPRGKAQRA